MTTLRSLLILSVIMLGVVALPSLSEAQDRSGRSGQSCGFGGLNCIEGPEIYLGDFAGSTGLSFSASPTSISQGNSSTLTWSATNAYTCSSSDFTVPVGWSSTVDGNTYTLGATSGSVSVSPSATKTYAMSCYGLGGEVTRSATVTVSGGSGPATPSTPTTPSTPSGPGGFMNVFQIDDNADHSALFDTVERSSPSLNPSTNSTLALVYTFPRAGTWWVRACADQNSAGANTVVESNEYNNCGEWFTITVDNRVLTPDLTAGSVSGSGLTTSAPTTLSSIVTNVGGAPVTLPFTNLFQIDDSNSDGHTSIVDVRTDTSPALGVNGSDVSTASYTFSRGGDWWVRACADNNASWVSTIAEGANEDNNCGEWTKLTVSTPVTACNDGIDNDGDGRVDGADAGCDPDDPYDPDGEGGDPGVDLMANPSSIRQGQSARLTWSSSGASSCTGTGFNTGGATDNASGVSVSPDETSDYEIQCGSARDMVRVTVSEPTAYITANPLLVDGAGAGGATSLQWSASEVSSCTIRSSQQSGPVFSGVPVVGTTTTAVTGIKKQTRFTLECTALVGPNLSAFVVVNVIPDYNEF